MEMEKVFEECIKIANVKFDGHMTLYKFTTNWRFCFGTPSDSLICNNNFYKGNTPEEAMNKALKNPKYVEENDELLL